MSPSNVEEQPHDVKEQLYLCIRTGSNSTPLWFVLGREKNVNRFMRPIPSLPSQPSRGSSVVSLDWGIYVIGGNIEGQGPTSNVFLLDCRTHTWCQAPSMRMARNHHVAGVVDGKIYVLGGINNDEAQYSGEVFDPKTQTWNDLVPMTDERDEPVWGSVVMGEKIHAMLLSDGSIYYSPSEGKWGNTENYDSYKEISSYCCVDGKLLYGCDDYGNVFWRESENIEWKRVKGLEALRNIFPTDDDDHVPLEVLPSNRAGELGPRSDPSKCYSELRSFGVNIVVPWFIYNDENVDVWCAEISLDKDKEIGEIWGKFEWSEGVATLSCSSRSDKVKVLYSASVNV